MTFVNKNPAKNEFLQKTGRRHRCAISLRGTLFAGFEAVLQQYTAVEDQMVGAAVTVVEAEVADTHELEGGGGLEHTIGRDELIALLEERRSEDEFY